MYVFIYVYVCVFVYLCVCVYNNGHLPPQITYCGGNISLLDHILDTIAAAAVEAAILTASKIIYETIDYNFHNI